MVGRTNPLFRLARVLVGVLGVGLSAFDCSALEQDRSPDLERANAALRIGDYTAARSAFQSHLAGGRNLEPARAGLLQTLFETGCYAEAAGLSVDFLAGQVSPAVLVEAGRIAAATGDYAQAETRFPKRACVLQSGARDGCEELADLLALMGRRSEAVRLWEGLVADYREGRLRKSEALGSAAVAAWRLGYTGDAKEIFLDATEERQNEPIALQSLADFGLLFWTSTMPLMPSVPSGTASRSTNRIPRRSSALRRPSGTKAVQKLKRLPGRLWKSTRITSRPYASWPSSASRKRNTMPRRARLAALLPSIQTASRL